MISRRLSMYSWMIRRASSERRSLGGRSTLPGRGSSGGFMPRRSAESQKEPLSQIKGTIRLRRGMERDQHDRSIGTPGPAPDSAAGAHALAPIDRHMTAREPNAH